MNILINRTDAIGDTILTMPIAGALKKKYPNCKVYFLISKKCEDLFRNHSYIDQAIVFPHSETFINKFKFTNNILEKLSIDNYFYVGGSHIPSLCAVFKGVRNRSGIVSKWPTFFLLNHGLRQKRSEAAKHEVTYNLELLKDPSLLSGNGRVAPVINLKALDVEKFNKEFNSEGKGLIFIHPGMTGHTLNWPSENYAKLIDFIESKYPNRFSFIISHTPSDERFLSPIREKESLENISFFNGVEKGLYHYMCILSQASLFVGPSTGTTHIANTLGVKTIGIYSPIKVQSSLRWGPFNTDQSLTRVVSPSVFKDEGPDEDCMRNISVEEVAKHAFDLIASGETREI